MADLRYAWRTLWKNPGFTAVAVIALALGIGANASVFTAVNSIVFRPYPFPELERIVRIWQTQPERGQVEEMVSAADFGDWRESSQTLEHLSAFTFWGVNLTGVEHPEPLRGFSVSPSFFQALGVQPLLGRAFAANEEQPGRDNVVLISHGLWERLFASDPRIGGRVLRLNGAPFTVIGVMPRDFDYPLDTEVWRPLAFRDPQNRDARHLGVLGRLRENAGIEQARSEMSAIAAQLAADYPDSNAGRGVHIRPLAEITEPPTNRFLLIQLAAAGFVLLLACANVANIQLARVTPRRRELALRLALGAGRWRITRGLLTETLLLALTGAVCGLLLAVWANDLQLASLPAIVFRVVPGLRQMEVNLGVVAFTAAVTVLTGLVCGIVPAIQACRKPDMNRALQEGGRGSTSPGRRPVRRALVVAEIATAMVLLVGAGMMVESFRRTLVFDVGYNPENLLVMDLSLPEDGYPEPYQTRDFYRRAVSELESLPEVDAASAAAGYGVEVESFRVEGQPEPGPAESLPHRRFVDGHYFQAMGLAVVAGRDFNDAEIGADAAPVVVVNQSLAQRWWPDPAEALGARLHLGYEGIPPLRVVGVATDFKNWYDGRATPTLYLPNSHMPRRSMELAVRTNRSPERVLAAARARLQSLDPELPVYDARTGEQRLNDSTSGIRYSAVNMSAFALIALLLAASGIYGVVSHSVARQTHDIGVRMALGAGRLGVLRLVLGETLRLTGAGLAIGGILAFALVRVMASVLEGFVTLDIAVFIALSLLLATVALWAGYLPARRAASVDPSIALRYE
ncbi:MAG: ABC transporter permease [bacterium]|nr:ABC transporter permease [bacterium]